MNSGKGNRERNSKSAIDFPCYTSALPFTKTTVNGQGNALVNP